MIMINDSDYCCNVCVCGVSKWLNNHQPRVAQVPPSCHLHPDYLRVVKIVFLTPNPIPNRMFNEF